MKGSMHTFVQVPLVDFINENYTNIGAFNLDHLSQTITQQKGEQTNLEKDGYGFLYMTDGWYGYFQS